MKLTKLDKVLLVDSKIPESHWALGIDTYFGTHTALKQTKHYCKNLEKALDSNVGLWLFGPPRSLKTFLGCLVLKEALAKGYSASYTDCLQLSDASFSKETRNNFSDLFGTDQFLILDNLDRTTHNGLKQAVRRLIHLRIDRGHPTILISSLSEDEVLECYGQELFNYLRESFVAQPCEVDAFAKELHYQEKIKGLEC